MQNINTAPSAESNESLERALPTSTDAQRELQASAVLNNAEVEPRERVLFQKHKENPADVSIMRELLALYEANRHEPLYAQRADATRRELKRLEGGRIAA